MNDYAEILGYLPKCCYCDLKADVWAMVIDTIDVRCNTRTFDNGYGREQVVATGKQEIYTKGQIIPCCKEHAIMFPLVLAPLTRLIATNQNVISELSDKICRQIKFEEDLLDGRV